MFRAELVFRAVQSAVAVLSIQAGAHAEVRPAVQGMACVPGGVAAVPLVRAQGDAWPASVPVQVDELLTDAVVVWIGTRDNGQRYWTRSPDQVDVRAIADAPEGAPPESTGTVLALFEVPALTGPVRVNGVPLEPQWLARGAWGLRGAAPMPWPTAPAPDKPDIETPSDYWRWCLLAQRLGQQPPAPPGTLPERLWARHVGWLWIAGLERVRQSSQAVHTRLVDALTATAVDPQLPPPGEVAGWIANPTDLRALLSVLLDASSRPEQIALSAESWLNAHWRVTMWVEADAGDRVRIAAINPTSEQQVLRLTWVEEGDAIPVAMPLEPRSVTRQWIDRPPAALPEPGATTVSGRGDRLDAMLGTLRRQVPIGPREYPVRPPGLSFSVFLPPLSLAEAQAGIIQPPPAEWRTWAQLRRRQSKWELMIECMRPPQDQQSAMGNAESSDEVGVQIGASDHPLRTIRVSADGRFAVDGGRDDGASAGFMRWDDRWRARIELPDAWIPASTAGGQGAVSRPFMLSIVRRPSRTLPRQTAALAVPPWTPGAPAVLVDLGAWSDM